MIETYNLGRKLGEYSMSNISYSYSINSPRPYTSSDPEKPQVIKVGDFN